MTLGVPQATVRAEQATDALVMFRRTEHRRGRLQADLDSLIYLVERRRATEGQYVRELREMRFNMKEHELRRAGGNATGLDSMKGVACHLREEADKTEEMHAAIWMAYETAGAALIVLAEELDLAETRARQAVHAALPATSVRDQPLSGGLRPSASNDRLPDRLDDPELSRRLLELQEYLERKYARSIEQALKTLEVERDEARASLALWIGRGDGLKGWQPSLEIPSVMAFLRQPNLPLPASLPNDIQRLIICAAIESTRPSLPFSDLATSVLQDERKVAKTLLKTCCLVHSTWRDIALPLLKKHATLSADRWAEGTRLGPLAHEIVSSGTTQILHLKAASSGAIHRLTSLAPFDALRTIIDVPVPLISEAPCVFCGLPSLESLSVTYPHEISQSQSLDLVFPELSSLTSLRLQTHHGDLHEAFDGLGRISLPHLQELQLSGVSYRGQASSINASLKTLSLFQKHGAGLRSLLLESVFQSVDVNWDTFGRAILGQLLQLQCLSTSIVELELLFERQFRDECLLVIGSSQLDVVRNSLVAGVRCRALLEFARRLAGVDHLLPWQMRCRLRFRSTLTSLRCWEVDFSIEPYRQSVDLALAAHYLSHLLGIALVDRNGVPHCSFWVAQSPAEIEAQLLREAAQRFSE